ncbi:MAG: methyl-accepting chemotaxis protein [Cognaticolwellia sp.]|jgi:methyl-accepting chemotaxis protein
MPKSMASLGLEIGVRCTRARRDSQHAVAVLIGQVSSVELHAGNAASELQVAVTSADHAAGLRRALVEQRRSMQLFGRELNTLLEEQNQLVQDLESGCGRIENVHNDMEDLAHEANMLAVNTAVSAARLGTRGATVGSVARHMQDLSRQVAETAQELAGRVTSLKERLPALSDGSEQLRELSLSLSGEIALIQSEFDGHTEQLGRCLNQALEESKDRSEMLRRDGRSAQGRLEMLHGFESRLDAIQELAVESMFMGGPERLLAALSGQDAIGKPDERGAPEAGDILLF